MSDLKELLAEKKRLATAQTRLDRKISAAKKRQMDAVRKKLEAVAAESGYTLADFVSSPRPAPSGNNDARTPKNKRRESGPPKYYHGGKGVDGRSARRSKAFQKVVTDGKIDDAKALKAGMINPAWLASSLPAARAIVRLHKVDVAAYTAG